MPEEKRPWMSRKRNAVATCTLVMAAALSSTSIYSDGGAHWVRAGVLGVVIGFAFAWILWEVAIRRVSGIASKHLSKDEQKRAAGDKG